MSESKHTPLPWVADYEGNIFGSDGCSLLTSGVQYAGEPDETPWSAIKKDEDAAFIVRACNSHYELVEALQECAKASYLDDYDLEFKPTREALVARAALAKAEGKQ